MMGYLVPHAVLSLIAIGIVATFAQRSALYAFAAGAALVGVNLLMLEFSWKRLLRKKLIALSIGVIVFKYATLGFIIYKVASQNLLHLGWFSAGLGMVIPTSLVIAYLKQQESTSETENT